MAKKLSIIVIEDNDFIRNSLIDLFFEKGHSTIGYTFSDALKEGIDCLKADVFIIDIKLPLIHSFNLAKKIRASNVNSGLIMVSFFSKINNKVRGYACGADIYLNKPVEPKELLAIIDRFSNKIKQQNLLNYDAKLLLPKLILEKKSINVKLTQHEADLLQAFAIEPTNILSRQKVIKILSSTKDIVSEISMEVRISGLRKKINSLGIKNNPITPIRKIGYRLCIELNIVRSL